MSFRRLSLLAMSGACVVAAACAPAVFAASAAAPANAATASEAGVTGLASLPASAATRAVGEAGPAYGPELQGFDYPAPLGQYDFTSQGVALHMAYMDIKPAHANGRTAVLLHGKNFCAATWETTIHQLSEAGYRVIAPDQIGFCKSSKPEHYQYSFQQLARNTHALLQSLGVTDATVIGHSTGGMLAIRYALMYPHETQQLVLVNPIGLEDWKAKGVPSLSVDQWYERELKTTADGIRRYEQSTYYAGQWRADYEPWVQMLAGMYRGPGKQIVAWNSALLYDMIYTQPVVYELGQLSMPTLLLIGQKDTTAIGKDAAPPEVRAKIGHYPELGRAAAKAIPHATLVEFADLGHAPQMQDPQAFHKALLEGLAMIPANR
ncbi:alpha/beta fold hydrolase [Paraburkholderia xenovorans]|uniref:Hydrolase protein, transmembrane, Alpha/beta hydrolase family fold protein n=1 Tax=Paraburkholderia xenovorans (strain LB400) TaxID=266265 RepID=Q141E5_PARXL|nr:alpha/beta hydrolase [Paraburkholderia xenovorans]ABE30044.1 Putative hydrolase protein, transmembrane, Alpha/beta hydrolase family fold protein [Paraburkholderia xenovorans LB400]